MGNAKGKKGEKKRKEKKKKSKERTQKKSDRSAAARRAARHPRMGKEKEKRRATQREAKAARQADTQEAQCNGKRQEKAEAARGHGEPAGAHARRRVPNGADARRGNGKVKKGGDERPRSDTHSTNPRKGSAGRGGYGSRHLPTSGKRGTRGHSPTDPRPTGAADTTPTQLISASGYAEAEAEANRKARRHKAKAAISETRALARGGGTDISQGAPLRASHGMDGLLDLLTESKEISPLAVAKPLPPCASNAGAGSSTHSGGPSLPQAMQAGLQSGKAPLQKSAEPDRSIILANLAARARIAKQRHLLGILAGAQRVAG